MIPFPGESISVDSFVNISGDPIAALADIVVREGSSTFFSGSEAELVVWFAANYLESADVPGDVSWCVEVVGGAGSLTLTERLGDHTPDTMLGTFDVAGTQTLVVPSSAITLADIYNESYGVLRLACTSGAVEVQQVKLRAFPEGGPLGGWGDNLHPAWERTSNASTESAHRVDGAAVGDGAFSHSLNWGIEALSPIASAYAATLGLMPAVIEGEADTASTPITLTPSGGAIGGDMNVTLHVESSTLPSPGASGGAVILLGDGTVAHRRAYDADINPAEGLVEGIDWVVSPYEVPGDAVGFAHADAAPVNSWINEYDVGGVALTLGEMINVEDDIGNDWMNTPLMGVVAWTPEVGLGGYLNLWPDHAGVLPVDLPDLPEVDHVLLAPTHGWFRGAAPPEPPPGPDIPEVYTYTYKNGFRWGLGAPIRYATAMPPYRVWTIDATTPRQLRQLHRDDGYGVTPPRAFGGASRIRTGRAYGYD